MKKILLLIVILSGCGYAAPDNIKGIVVTKIEESNVDGCWYYGKGNRENTTTLSFDYQIKDVCGKFNVGDTIILSKK